MARTLKLGDREVARIGLGTNRLRPSNVEFVRGAVAAGIGHIDTAHLYSGGESEATIGEALSPVPEGCVVATKGGFRPGESEPEILAEQLQESLRRLRTGRIELYYLHKVHPQTPVERSMSILADARERGQIAHVGISNASVADVERAREVVSITAVQNHYNLSDREHEDVLDYCTEQAIVFVPYFPLHADAPALGEIAERHGATEAQIQLAWLLKRSPVTLPIPGTLSVEHAQENLAALDIELSDEEFDRLR
jgi:aryl-alcohol dehydrogenase-like predicted oxidoreductase